MPNQNYANSYYSNGPVQYGAQTQMNPNFSIPMGQTTGMAPSQQVAPQQIQQPMPRQIVMSIASIRGGRMVAEQFPVAAGTELWLIDKEASKIYIKSNPMNPAEMQEADFSFVEQPVNQNAPVSRAEFDELKGMMSQMLATMKDRKKHGDWKRGNRDAESNGVSTDAE